MATTSPPPPPFPPWPHCPAAASNWRTKARALVRPGGACVPALGATPFFRGLPHTDSGGGAKLVDAAVVAVVLLLPGQDLRPLPVKNPSWSASPPPSALRPPPAARAPPHPTPPTLQGEGAAVEAEAADANGSLLGRRPRARSNPLKTWPPLCPSSSYSSQPPLWGLTGGADSDDGDDVFVIVVVASVVDGPPPPPIDAASGRRRIPPPPPPPPAAATDAVAFSRCFAEGGRQRAEVGGNGGGGDLGGDNNAFVWRLHRCFEQSDASKMRRFVSCTMREKVRKILF